MSYYRKVIHICAEDSPNVQLGLREVSLGYEPSGKVIVPGVLPWFDYVKRRTHWDAIRQCIGLDGRFYKGAELLLFPPTWLDHSERLAVTYRSENRKRTAKAIGVDPGEGGANTAIVTVDELGVIDLWSRPTPDTNVIHSEVIHFMEKYGVPDLRVVFDAGGGGKQIVHRMRSMGLQVRAVAFGESVMPPPRPVNPPVGKRVDEREERYVYMNRRAQMYGELSEVMDPQGLSGGFAIPSWHREFRRQLSVIPKTYNEEGRLYILPKNKKDPNSKKPTLTEIMGCSPDESDALVLAVHAMLHTASRSRVGAVRQKREEQPTIRLVYRGR